MSAGAAVATRRAAPPEAGRDVAEQAGDVRQPSAARGQPSHESRRARGSSLTLGQRMTSVWEELHAAGAAICPVCDSRMDRAVGLGRCRSCGSILG